MENETNQIVGGSRVLGNHPNMVGCKLVAFFVALWVFCPALQAVVVITASPFDPGGGNPALTEWTVSGSGVTTGALAAADTHDFTGWSTDWATFIGGAGGIGGSWSFNGKSTDSFQFFSFFQHGDQLLFSFDSDIAAGESLAGLSGSILSALSFSTLQNLPTNLTTPDPVFGAVTIAAVPEPSSVAFGLATLTIGGVAIWRRRTSRKAFDVGGGRRTEI